MNFLQTKFARHGLIGAVGLSAIAFVGVTKSVQASNITLGSDYFISPEGFSTFVFDSNKLNAQLGLGLPADLLVPIELRGRPLGQAGLGNTDTIVQRQEDAIFDIDGDNVLDRTTVTIPIEMVTLSLESVAPVTINGFNYDLFASLDPQNPTTGEMTITHNGIVGQAFDDSGPSQGTFTSFLDVFYQVEFTATDGGPEIDNFFDNLLLTQPAVGTAPAQWSHQPTENTILVNDPDPQIANCHALAPGCAPDDFFAGLLPDGISGTVVLHQKGSPFFPEGHGTVTTCVTPCIPIPPETVPEPSTVLASIFGLGTMLSLKRKRASNNT